MPRHDACPTSYPIFPNTGSRDAKNRRDEPLALERRRVSLICLLHSLEDLFEIRARD
jgi:hypothetical protein